MSKPLSEEQIENIAEKLFPENGWGHPDDSEIRAKQDGFKAAFSLLMPIIEKQADELGYYADPENWIKRTGEAWNKCCPKSKGDEEMIRRYKHPGKDWFGTVVVGGKRARQVLQETKQMLEQLGEKK